MRIDTLAHERNFNVDPFMNAYRADMLSKMQETVEAYSNACDGLAWLIDADVKYFALEMETSEAYHIAVSSIMSAYAGMLSAVDSFPKFGVSYR